MELTPDSLYIKYVRLKEEDETPQTYPYTVPALANFRRLEFRRPGTSWARTAWGNRRCSKP